LPELLDVDVNQEDQEYPEPTVTEVQSAMEVKEWKSTAPDLCGITAAILKASGVSGVQCLTNVIISDVNPCPCP